MIEGKWTRDEWWELAGVVSWILIVSCTIPMIVVLHIIGASLWQALAAALASFVFVSCWSFHCVGKCHDG